MMSNFLVKDLRLYLKNIPFNLLYWSGNFITLLLIQLVGVNINQLNSVLFFSGVFFYNAFYSLQYLLLNQILDDKFSNVLLIKRSIGLPLKFYYISKITVSLLDYLLKNIVFLILFIILTGAQNVDWLFYFTNQIIIFITIFVFVFFMSKIIKQPKQRNILVAIFWVLTIYDVVFFNRSIFNDPETISIVRLFSPRNLFSFSETFYFINGFNNVPQFLIPLYYVLATSVFLSIFVITFKIKDKVYNRTLEI